MIKNTNIIRFGIELLSKELFDYGVAILRAGVGVMMFVHGVDKFIHYQAKAQGFLDPFGVGGELSLALAIFAEGICSILVIIGFSLRLTLLPLITTMLVAFFIAHSSDPYATKEIALLYLVVYVTLLVMGPGRLSLDHMISRRLEKVSNEK